MSQVLEGLVFRMAASVLVRRMGWNICVRSHASSFPASSALRDQVDEFRSCQVCGNRWNHGCHQYRPETPDNLGSERILPRVRSSTHASTPWTVHGSFKHISIIQTCTECAASEENTQVHNFHLDARLPSILRKLLWSKLGCKSRALTLRSKTSLLDNPSLALRHLQFSEFLRRPWLTTLILVTPSRSITEHISILVVTEVKINQRPLSCRCRRSGTSLVIITIVRIALGCLQHPSFSHRSTLHHLSTPTIVPTECCTATHGFQSPQRCISRTLPPSVCVADDELFYFASPDELRPQHIRTADGTIDTLSVTLPRWPNS